MAKLRYLGPSIEKDADGAIDKSKAIAIIDGKAVYADNTDTAHRGQIRGISTASVSDGDPLCVQEHGPYIEAGWSWTANQVLYCSTAGNLTQTKPASGDIVIFGTAISATEIYVDIHRWEEQQDRHLHVREVFTLDGTDISNAFVLLGQTPLVAAGVQAQPQGSPLSRYGVDYVMDGSNVKKLKWGGLGWAGKVAAGQTIDVRYYRSGA